MCVGWCQRVMLILALQTIRKPISNTSKKLKRRKDVHIQKALASTVDRGGIKLLWEYLFSPVFLPTDTASLCFGA